MKQYPLFPGTAVPSRPSKFILSYRVTLVRDRALPFEPCCIGNSQQAQPIIKKLIETSGNSDREQFCIIMLNAKNESIGVNIVSTGSVTSAQVCPREVLKPAILANAVALVLAHNHPSGSLSPSPDDLALTERIIQATGLLGMTVHEHLILSMMDDGYFSFADQGIIQRMYDKRT
jgi:DNA repair protein RadC